MKPIQYVAEMSGNHLGSLRRALLIIKAAAYSGATAVKLQTFEPAQMVGNEHCVVPSGPWAGKRLIDLYRETHTPKIWHPKLFSEIRAHGMTPISSPFHPDDVTFLETLDCPVYKISSFELTYVDLLKEISDTGKKVVISTGMATHREIHKAIDIVLRGRIGMEDITLLKCTSAYPADVSAANIETMAEYPMIFGLPIKTGVSDHTLGNAVPAAATAFGASMIEKHFTLHRIDGGHDASFSVEPSEFLAMVSLCDDVYKSLGSVKMGPTNSEISSRALRRSVWYSKDVEAGTRITREHLKVCRPYNGTDADMSPFIGSIVMKDARSGDPLDPEWLSQ